MVGRPAGFTAGAGYSVAYGYDSVGRMNGVTWNTGAGAKAATYAYVANSDLINSVATGSLVTGYSYEPNRDVKTRVRHTYGDADIAQYDYTYDAGGRRNAMSVTPDPVKSFLPADTTYTPNNLNQYQAIDKNDVVDNPVYDDDGNLISSSVIPAEAGIQSTKHFAWDGENRLISVAPQTPAEGDKKVEFVYDYMGRRVSKAAFLKALMPFLRTGLTDIA